MQEQHIDGPVLEVSHHTKGHVQNKQTVTRFLVIFAKKKGFFHLKQIF